MRIPLHGKGTNEEKLDLHMYMNQMNSRGFRTPPTSKKNPKTRSKHPVTRAEFLARLVYGVKK